MTLRMLVISLSALSMLQTLKVITRTFQMFQGYQVFAREFMLSIQAAYTTMKSCSATLILKLLSGPQSSSIQQEDRRAPPPSKISLLSELTPQNIKTSTR